jgi:uncharacterized protein YggT (Ycf19 family)
VGENPSVVGDTGVGSLLLADTATSVQRFVSVFVGVYVLLIFAYIVASWVPGGASPTLERVRQFLYDVCEPYLRLFRRVIPPLGPLDLSPIAAVFSLYVLGMLVNALIDRIL